MRFLADENVPGPAVTRLRAGGHDVSWIRKEAPGCPDAEVVERARIERRILLTFDKDFGEWVFRQRKEVPGVILFRLTEPLGQEALSRWIARVMDARSDWEGHFSTAAPEGRLRMRPLRSGP
ncbi:MAG: DUF5615 family PIN-like protein [Candidatus Lambdaproteobacteria bacterium]|nr:DUF5615 family PIN-like protein [Candidatus Lambdaproteobacteria bacterium]